MEIGIAHDPPVESADGDGPDDRFEEYDAPSTIDAVTAALEAGGYTTRKLGGGRELLRELLERPPELVFNMAEGAGTRSREAHVPAVCELLGVPYTHSDPLTLAASLDKAVAKSLVAAAGLPTPRAQVVDDARDKVDLAFPVLAKPLAEGSSMGIRLVSRCNNPAELRGHLERLLRDYGQPVLVEEFCPGPELTVGILGTGAGATVLGVMEVVPLEVPVEEFVYSLEVKRTGDSVAYNVPPRRPQELIARAEAVALGAYRALGCRDVARIDLRLDADGEPNFLEANPLPGLRPAWGDLVILAGHCGVEFDELIGRIVAAARAAGDLTVRVAILFNDDERLEHGEAVDAVAVQAVLEAVDAVEAACRELGWEPSRVAFGAEIDADVVFNLVEGTDEAAAARFLEAAGMPFTGSPGDSLELACDKPAARAALEAAGVPIPRGCVLETGAEPFDNLRFPAIVKPAREDASHGIALESLVEDEDAARARGRYLLERYRQPALVEEFAPGPELGVSLLGAAEVLPMTEILYSGGLRLLTYASKWLPESADYASAVAVERADDPEVAAIARLAWTAIGLCDYGRVDVRLMGTDEPVVIDVNPNPDVSPGAGLANAAARAGIGYTELIGRIVEGALVRSRATATAAR